MELFEIPTKDIPKYITVYNAFMGCDELKDPNDGYSVIVQIHKDYIKKLRSIRKLLCDDEYVHEVRIAAPEMDVLRPSEYRRAIKAGLLPNADAFTGSFHESDEPLVNWDELNKLVYKQDREYIRWCDACVPLRPQSGLVDSLRFALRHMEEYVYKSNDYTCDALRKYLKFRKRY